MPQINRPPNAIRHIIRRIFQRRYAFASSTRQHQFSIIHRANLRPVIRNLDFPDIGYFRFFPLTRARDALRKVDKAGGKEIRVWLRGGVYRIADTVV